MITKREKRVLNAFFRCVKAGEFTYDYAVTLIEDTDRYGYLSEEAKRIYFYNRFKEENNNASESEVDTDG